MGRRVHAGQILQNPKKIAAILLKFIVKNVILYDEIMATSSPKEETEVKVNGFGRGEDTSPDKRSILTKETVGMTMLLFGIIILMILITGPLIFGEIGTAITAFFVGVAGFFAYPLFALMVLSSLSLIAGKQVIPARWLVRPMLLLAAVFLIVHTATDGRFFFDGAASTAVDYGTYLSGCWNAAAENVALGTGGGVLFGLIAYPIRLVLSEAGAYVLYSVLTLAALVYLLFLTPLRSLVVKTPRRQLPKRTGEEGKEISFGDLPASPVPASPVPTSYAGASFPPAQQAPAGAQPRMTAERATMSAPMPHETSRPASPAPDGETERQRRSREILFGGTAAERYRNNLIFDENSAFNTRPRGSSLRPNASDPADDAPASASPYTPVGPTPYTPAPGYTPPAPSYPSAQPPLGSSYTPAPGYTPPSPFGDPAAKAAGAFPPPADRGYSRSYSDDAEDARPPMPRRTRSVGRDYEEDNGVRYPEPQYRAPVQDAPIPDDPGRLAPPADRRPTMPVPPAPVRPAAPMPASVPPAPPRDLGDRGMRDTGRDASDDLFDDTEAPDRDIFFGGREDRTRLGGFSEPEEEPDSAASLFDDDEPRSARGLRDIAASESFEPVTPIPPTPDPAPMPAPEPPAPAPAPLPKKKKHVWKKYRRPPLDLLSDYEDRPQLSNEEIGRNSGIILDTLRRYRIETRVKKVVGGASVTRYDLEMPANATINMVTKYSGELAVFLNVDGVNMYANPEVGGISVEVPNDHRSTVGLKNMLRSKAFLETDPDALTVAIGQDIEGRWVCGDITKMTHVLVAGQTNSGKSITIHAMIASMIYKYSPEDLRLILIDPKQTEFVIYEGLPHLMINEIVVDPPKAISALRWAVKEMERRYSLFNEKTRSGMSVRKIDEYNAVRTEDEEKMPKLVIIVDEFSDLMLSAKKELEELIRRLTQKARAAGIHVILATQRPSAEVVTGTIKSNLPTRVALRVDSELNSRIILDEGGAEKLLGNGDMLYKEGGKARRLQGAFISTHETQDFVNYIRENNEAYFDDDALDYIEQTGGGGESESVSAGGGEGGGGEDGSPNEVYLRALAMVVRRKQASISLIQRSCGVGYNHAGKIIEWMESMGYISPFDGKAKARSVLLTKEEYEAKYGPLD